MTVFERAYRCSDDGNSDGCGRVAAWSQGAPGCCPSCGSQEILFGVAEFDHNEKASNWRPVRRIQNPAASHIPMALNKARRARELPWRVTGSRIMLFMLTNEEREQVLRDDDGKVLVDEHGKAKSITIAATSGHMGEEKDRTFGLVVAYGAGEVTPSGGYISPEHDFDLTVGSVVMIDPNSGQRHIDDTATYRSITPWDVVAVLHPDYGQPVYQKLRTRAEKALSKYKDNPDDVGFQTPSVPSGMAVLQTPEELLEKARTVAGSSTKVQFVVPGLKKE